jgi:hypothetical protein
MDPNTCKHQGAYTPLECIEYTLRLRVLVLVLVLVLVPYLALPR